MPQSSSAFPAIQRRIPDFDIFTMKTGNLAVLSVSLVALAVATGAGAQPADEPQQTPENAQRFLATVLPGMDFVDHRLGDVVFSPWLSEHYTLDGKRWTGPSVSEISRLSRQARTSVIRSVQQADAVCTSTLQIFASPVVYTGPTVRTYIRGSQIGTDVPSDRVREEASKTITIDWRKATSARSEGASAFISTSQTSEPLSWRHQANGTKEIQVRLSDEGMAARVAYAAEFLRLSCDQTADTGF
jgi:hypothetical protein